MKLKEIRDAKGMTQTDLATASGVSISFIRLIESGAAGQVSDKIQGKIVGVLGSVPKEFQPRKAVWKSELFSEPNQILSEPVRLFANELLAAAEKAGSPADFLKSCREGDSFLSLQRIFYMAKQLKVKLPKV